MSHEHFGRRPVTEAPSRLVVKIASELGEIALRYGRQVGIARHEAANALVGILHSAFLPRCAGITEPAARADAIFQSPETGKLRAAIKGEALACRGWQPLPHIAVFDDAFVAQNVCSGIEIETAHRQNLHELILGGQGVQLNAMVLQHIAAIEQHNRTLKERTDAIPVATRGALTVDAFCALQADAKVDGKIEEAERQLAAARAADAVQHQDAFQLVSLSVFDPAAINSLLARDLPALEAAAAARVQAHFGVLGQGGEAWVSQGMGRIGPASAGEDHEVCPFCEQDLRGSPLIAHYQAYFSAEYQTLKTDIATAISGVNTAHAGDIPAAFERGIRTAAQTSEFWTRFTQDVPAVGVDTAAITRVWNAARTAVVAALRLKQASPLEPSALSAEAQAAIDAYEAARRDIEALSARLQAANTNIAIVKERAAGANLAALTADLQRLGLVRTRHTQPATDLCTAYLVPRNLPGSSA